MTTKDSGQSFVYTQAGKSPAFRRIRLSAAIGIVGLLLVAGMSDSVFAAKGGVQGPPTDGGGSGSPPDYGDLIILHRDANGVPIPSPAITVTDPETGLPVDGGLCWQPKAFSSENCTADTLAAMGCDDWDTCVVPVDQYSCAVEAGFTGCTQEVDFGRINEARAPDTVLASQLEDVIVKVATADEVGLDPAGRLVTCTDDGDIDSVSAIDSPLQSLAIYKELMLKGTLGVELPDDAMMTAARALGTASDKSGEVNIDLVAYLNQIMGLSDPATSTFLPKLCETYREEVQGNIQLVEKCFLDFGQVPGGGAYEYARIGNFNELPHPAYIPGAAPVQGWFEYLWPIGSTATFEILQGPVNGTVFGNTAGFEGGNIGGFAQAADDAREVINFMHTWPVPDPDTYATKVSCGPSGQTPVDVSISPESGLQVPTQMVDGSEGREFTVTVTNVGTNPATGTVTVTASAANGVPIVGSPWVYDFTSLAAGQAFAKTQLFSIKLGARTTINWEATADAAGDVNLGNNRVTATTSVKVTGGGGGGGGKPKK